MADQPSPRRRFQFRLRTLMIGVTAVALLSPFVVRLVRERQRADADRAILKAAGAELNSAGASLKAADAAMKAADNRLRLKGLQSESGKK